MSPRLVAVGGAVIGLGSLFTTALWADEGPSPTPAVAADDAQAGDDESYLLSKNRRPSAQFVKGIDLVSQPATVEQPEEPVVAAEPVSAPTNGFGGFLDLSALSTERQEEASVGASDVVYGTESEVRNTTDSNDLLVRSTSSTGVFVHTRNPISNDVRIRGFRFSQIRSHVHGAFWVPIRPDFDTPLSKLDSSLIRDVIITKGPYTVRQGPGFSFIDIELMETPRAECGCREWGGRTAFIFDTNGDQFNARQTVTLGTENSGLRVGYGDRGGVDYLRGDGRRVASGYHSHDWDLAYGYDFSPDSRLEFNYQRVDQTDVELPAQYFDIDFLVADGFSLRYTLENQCHFDRLRIDAWWNRTRFGGNEENGNKPGVEVRGSFGNGNGQFSGFPVLTNNGNIGEVRSTGVRAAMTWGVPDCPQLTIGTDYTFYDQEYIETSLGSPFHPPYFRVLGLPRTQVDDVGIFADMSLPVTERLTFRPGGRVDWNDNSLVPGTVVLTPNDIDREFNLYLGTLGLEYDLNDVWTARLTYGFAERSPSPTDLYTRTFLELLQPGGDLSFRGNGNLAKEKLHQIDAGLTAEFSDFRGGVNLFVGWIEDYITYQFGPDPMGLAFRAMNTVNTDARLAGGEVFGEFDMGYNWVTFAAVSYVQATDRIRNEPLWGIPPLDTRLGLRYQPENWGLEFSARIVDDQDRIAQGIFTDGVFTSFPRVERETPGFTVLDLRGYYRWSEGVRLVAGIENIGDLDYQEHLDSRVDLTYGTPGGVFRPGINFYGGIIATY
jgi:iron complex outermembrane receptor protein